MGKFFYFPYVFVHLWYISDSIILLQQMSDLVLESMRVHGTQVLMPAVPLEIEKAATGQLIVKWKQDGIEGTDTYDTVMMAIG